MRPRRNDQLLGSIAANVRRMRERRGWTQEKLAEAAELDLRYLQRIERGQVNVSVTVLCGLATALDATPARLLRSAAPPDAARVGRPRKKKARSA